MSATKACAPAVAAPPPYTLPKARLVPLPARKRQSRRLGPAPRPKGGARPAAVPALAPGTEATYAALTDPARRPARPRSAIREDVLLHVPTDPPLFSHPKRWRLLFAKRVVEGRRACRECGQII